MSSSSSPSLMKRGLAFLQSEHFEVTLRMSLSILVGNILTFSELKAVPINTNILMGMLVPFCTMLFPTLIFTYGSVIIPLFSIFFFVYLSSSILLAIAVGTGTGGFVAAFSIWSFWICFTRWHKTEGTKTAIILISVVFQTVLIWPSYETVNSGITIPDSSLGPIIQTFLLEMTSEAYEIAKTFGVGTHLVEITSGTFRGRTAKIEIFNDGTFQTKLDGGMWVIGKMWSIWDTTNPMANFSNIMIFSLLLMAVLSIAIFMPPFRTIRSAVWRGILPAALNDGAKVIRLHAARMTKKDAEMGGDALLHAEEENEDTSEASRLATRGRCFYHINVLFGEELAKYTVFEPRLLDCKPPEWTVAYLVQLTASISRCLRMAVGIDILTQYDDDTKFLHGNTDHYLEVATTLETCAKALLVGNAELLDELETNVEEPDESMENASEDSKKNKMYDPFQFEECASTVVKMSRMWLLAMGPSKTGGTSYCSKASFNAFLNNFRPWIFVHLSFPHFLIEAFKSLFKKSSWWSLRDPDKNTKVQLFWCIKHTAALTFLLCLQIYWPLYREDFAFSKKNDPLRSTYAFQNGGWAMVAFCFISTQTTEGSLKKGILRTFGLLLGGFSAWLALVACEDSSYNRNYNVYGIVSWISFTSFLVVYFVTERGFAARLSLSNEYAYASIYFILTQVVITTYVYFYYGPDGRNETTLNRMMTNLLGVILAIILAFIPPSNFGGDPIHCRRMVRLQWKSTTKMIRLLLTCKLDDDGEPLGDDCEKIAGELLKLRATTLEKSAKMQALVMDFEKDAARLQAFPKFKVDTKLKPEIGLVTRDSYICGALPQFAANMIVDADERGLLLGRESYGRKELEKLLTEMEHGIGNGKDRTPLPHSDLSPGQMDLELLVRSAYWLRNEMVNHEKKLDDVKWGV